MKDECYHRPVQFWTNQFYNGEESKSHVGVGKFLKWGVDTEENYGSFTAAVIEKADGSLILKGIYEFRFTDTADELRAG